MALGPGKYDDLCTEVREKAEAEGVILIVFNGNKGQGLSCQLPLKHTLAVSHILRDLVDLIEKDRTKVVES